MGKTKSKKSSKPRVVSSPSPSDSSLRITITPDDADDDPEDLSPDLAQPPPHDSLPVRPQLGPVVRDELGLDTIDEAVATLMFTALRDALDHVALDVEDEDVARRAAVAQLANPRELQLVINSVPDQIRQQRKRDLVEFASIYGLVVPTIGPRSMLVAKEFGKPRLDAQGLEVVDAGAAGHLFVFIEDAVRGQDNPRAIISEQFNERELQLILNSVPDEIRSNNWSTLIMIADVYGQDVPRTTDQNMRDKLVGHPKLLARLNRWAEISPYPLDEYPPSEALAVLDNQTWLELTQARSRRNEPQRFGVEVELNSTKIRYYANGQDDSRFRDFAVRRGHKGIMTHPGLPFELHLDHLDPQHAKLEIVGNPPQPPKIFIENLAILRTMLSGRDVKELIAQFEWSPDVPDDMRQYVLRHLKGSSRIGDGQPVQVTTTHTANELATVVERTGEQFIRTRYPPERGRPSEDIRIDRMHAVLEHDAEADLDDFVINEYLGHASTARSRATPGKGTGALIKHAAEQFDRFRGDLQVDPGLVVDRITRDTPVLNELHTLANKLAPVFERNGQIAYVVEYRSGSRIGRSVADYLQDGQNLSGVGATLDKYLV